MIRKMTVFAAALGAMTAGAAEAREPFDDVFFVRIHASAAELYQERTECRSTAEHMSDTAASYSNPQYGALSAMGSALDEDALHEGGLHKRLQRAVFDDCMKEKGWTLVTPTEEELKTLLRASPRHPQAVNDWLRGHEPPPPPIPAPAAPVVATAQSTPAAVTN